MTTFIIDSGSSSTAGGDVPIICYDNVFRDSGASVTTSGEATGFEAEQAYDWLTNTSWQADAAGNAWVRVDAGSARSCDYFAAYVPNLATNGGTIKLQYSDNDSTWTDAHAALSPTSAVPLVAAFFTSESHRYWRIFVASTPASQIPVVSAGQRSVFDQGLREGFTPPLLSRDMDIMNSETVGGQFINRVIRRRGCRQVIKCENNSEAWTRNTWLPIVKHAELLPFFWFWQPTGRPTEAALLWAEKIDDSSYNRNEYHRISMTCRGVCNDLL